MRGVLPLVVVVLLAAGCAHPCDTRIYDDCNLVWYPTMTTEDLATASELRVQQVVEGASRGLK